MSASPAALIPPSPAHHPSCPSLAYDGAQYLGLIALVTNFIGFFAHFFVELPKNAPYDACRSYFRVMPIMQCFASWASHAVFVVRVRGLLPGVHPEPLLLVAIDAYPRVV